MIFSPSETNDWNGSQISLLKETYMCGHEYIANEYCQYATNQTIFELSPQSTLFSKKENRTKIVTEELC